MASICPRQPIWGLKKIKTHKGSQQLLAGFIWLQTFAKLFKGNDPNLSKGFTFSFNLTQTIFMPID